MNQDTIKIILAGETRLLREMLKRVITRSPGLLCVGEITRQTDLTPLVERTEAQWIVTSLREDGEIAGSAERALEHLPSVYILAVAADGSRVKVKWKEPLQKKIARDAVGKPLKVRWTEAREKELGDLSLNELVTVLKRGIPDENK